MIRALVALAAGLFMAQAGGASAQTTALRPVVRQAVDQWMAGDPGGKTKLVGLAVKGDADAQFVVGGALFAGANGFPVDRAKACRFWRQAVPARADAAHLDAECVERGYDGSNPDLSRARDLYAAAARRGSAKSKCALGNLLIAGKGGPADAPRGVALCREGAEAGDPDAQADLGDFYLLGRNVPRDIGEARAWYEKAAAQGQKNASLTLGQIYWNGDGVAKDNVKAAILWRRAYAKGRLDAAPLLGDEAFVRATASKDRVDQRALDEAIEWYEKAIAQDPAMTASLSGKLDLLRKMKTSQP